MCTLELYIKISKYILFKVTYGFQKVNHWKKRQSSIEFPQVPYDCNKFHIPDHEEVHNQLSSRKFIMERNMQLEDPNKFFSFVQELENMG